VHYYETAFHKATGVTLRLVPPEPGNHSSCREGSGNPFCTLMGSLPSGCSECQEAENRIRNRAAVTLSQQQVHCYAGLTVVAVPILSGGHHVATMVSGQVFRREPTERDFLLVAKMLNANSEWLRKARKAYFDTPVVTVERFQAILQLLNVFAHYLADVASKHAIASSEPEPKPVTEAKQFVHAHVEEPITLEAVVEQVHVSKFYFCKLFKKATGMTLTEYVARVRVEKAKSLLVDPSLRISEVVFAAGFGSIPRFNTVFKRYVGMAPTEYRASLRAPLPL